MKDMWENEKVVGTGGRNRSGNGGHKVPYPPIGEGKGGRMMREEGSGKLRFGTWQG